MGLCRQHRIIPALAYLALARCRPPPPTVAAAPAPRIDPQRGSRDRIVQVVAGPESTCVRITTGAVA